MTATDATVAPPAPETIDYVARWRALIERRRVQMDGAYAKAGLKDVDYWGRRAKSYQSAMHSRASEDPFLTRLRAEVSSGDEVLDVGAGTGRFTLPIARIARRVVAVDPSPAMLGLLRADAEREGLTNIDVVQAEWLTADVEPADVVICSHVLYPIADIVPFVRKLEAKATRRVLVYHRVDFLPTDFGLWPEFHGEPLQPQPSHMDLLNVLTQVDIVPGVEIVSGGFTLTAGTFDEALAWARNSLCLREHDTEAEAKLRRLLEERLIRHEDGRLGMPAGPARSAIISWRPALRGRASA